MTVGRETVEAALFDGFRGTALGGAHEGWSRNMARIATDAVMPLVKSEMSERESIATLLRRRAIKEAPNASGALLFMADIIQHDRGLPEDMLGEATTPEEVVELTPVQAGVMLTARQAELDRARHEAEPWLSRAEMDRVKRIDNIRTAVALGVPLSQVQRFIWGEKLVPKEPVSETKNAEREWLVRELRVLSGFVTGTRNGELVPLADFTRERITKAITMAADALEVKP